MTPQREAAYLAAVKALTECAALFAEIRSDWSDPRLQCRAGQQVIAEALALAEAAEAEKERG